MNAAILTLSFLCTLACPALAQGTEREWVELHFHRLYLKNGNFIDGELSKQTDKGVTLLLKAGEITIRNDLIDRVEFMKIRTVNEKPEGFKPKPPAPATTPSPLPPFPLPSNETKRTPQETRLDPMVTRGFSKGIVEKVDDILARFKKDISETKYLVLQEISSFGTEAAVYVATNLGAFPEETLTYVGPILSQMKVAETRPPLTKAFAHWNPNVRRQAALIVGELGDPAGTTDLLPMLNDFDAIVRGQALEAVVKLGSREAVEPVAKRCTDPDRALRGKALAGLQQLLKKLDQERDLLPMLSRAIENSKGAVRADIAAAVAKTGNPEAWTILTPLLPDPEPQVRQAAAAGLMIFQVPESAEAILARLPAEDDKWARVYLANAAQRVNARRSVEILITWLDDPDTDVKAAAHQALRNLTAQGMDQNRENWEKWFRQNAAQFR